MNKEERKSKMKKIISLMLTIVLLVSFCGIFAEAAFDEGSYNGYAYEAYLNATNSTVSGSMTYQGTTKIRIEGTGYYINGSGLSVNMNLLTDRQVSSVTLWEPVPSGHFTLANCDFKVGAAIVANLTASP